MAANSVESAAEWALEKLESLMSKSLKPDDPAWQDLARARKDLGRYLFANKQNYNAGFGALIKKERKATGLTQEGLAASVGLSRTSLTNVEAGRQGIALYTAHKLCVAVGISFDVASHPTEEGREDG